MLTDAKRVVGLTGGIATGKSTVAEMFHRLGAAIVDADVLARQVLEPGSAELNAVVSLCGNDILNQDNTLNRKKLRELIVRDEKIRQSVNEITHPRIIELETEAIAESLHPLVIVDAALMIESGSHVRFRELVLVYAPVSIQLERIMKRDGLTRSEAEAFLKTQMDIEEKRKYATYMIENTGTIEETAEQVVRLHEVFST